MTLAARTETAAEPEFQHRLTIIDVIAEPAQGAAGGILVERQCVSRDHRGRMGTLRKDGSPLEGFIGAETGILEITCCRSRPVQYGSDRDGGRGRLCGFDAKRNPAPSAPGIQLPCRLGDRARA